MVIAISKGSEQNMVCNASPFRTCTWIRPEGGRRRFPQRGTGVLRGVLEAMFQSFIYTDSTYIPDGVIFKSRIPDVGTVVTDDLARQHRAGVSSDRWPRPQCKAWRFPLQRTDVPPP